MYTIIVETGAIAPVAPPNENHDTDPGTEATIHFVLHGEKNTSQDISVSGKTGEIRYGSEPVGRLAQIRATDGTLTESTTPFLAGQTAVLEVAVEGLELGALHSVEISHNGSTTTWYPLGIEIEDAGHGTTYYAEIDTWLSLEQKSVECELVSDYTTPDGEVSPKDDIVRIDLSRELLSIRPTDGVRFTFNDAVDLESFDPTRPEGRARSLSIRYTDELEGGNISPEVSATVGERTDWTLAESGVLTSAGTYIWEDERTLVLAPPEGGWPYGRCVRFEFDRSLHDDAGNRMREDRDQVIVVRVTAEVSITIESPVKERTYLPWKSGDDPRGDPADFHVYVSGTVRQRGAREHVESIIVTARNENDRAEKTVLTVGYDIPIGPDAYDHLERDGVPQLADGTTRGCRWSPDAHGFGGRWAIHLPLQDPEYQKDGAQAVAEKRYKWKIEAFAIAQKGMRVPSGNHKIVYHEIFKPHVTSVTVVPGEEVYRHVLGEEPATRPLKFTAKDLGPKNFAIEVRGDFDGAARFQHHNTYDPTTSDQFLAADIQQSDDVPQGEEEADVTLPSFVIDKRTDVKGPGGRNKNDTTHTLTFSAKTKARSVVVFHLHYEVDTIPLDIERAESVSLNFPDSD